MKTYWQTIDSFGRLETYTGDKPKTYADDQGRTSFDATTSKYLGAFHLFPMVLKPLQIVEITVNENGTWSYEIEREEGWYCAKSKANGKYYYLKYKNYCWFGVGGGCATADLYTISKTRIPDECII